jgi:hypothetical protein
MTIEVEAPLATCRYIIIVVGWLRVEEASECQFNKVFSFLLRVTWKQL